MERAEPALEALIALDREPIAITDLLPKPKRSPARRGRSA
jgi:hypothetical protein